MELAELHQIAEHEQTQQKPLRIRCCTAAGCVSSGSLAVKQAFDREIAAQGLGDRVQACSVGCLRLCCAGPLVQVDPSQELYEQVKPEQVPSIVNALLAGRVKRRRRQTRRRAEALLHQADADRS